MKIEYNCRRVVGMLLAGAVTTAATAEVNFEAVENKVRTLVPGAATVAVSESPMSGLLQVQIQNEIYYVSSDGEFLINGPMINTSDRTNLTEQAKAVLREEVMKDVSDDQTIAFSPESVDYDLFVFTDIDCGYCRKLHDQVDEYMEQGIAIHYMAFPRAGIGSHSYDKAVSVWCADDQQFALTDAKLGNEPEPLECENPVAEQYQLGQTLGVTGTPALLLRDGTMIPGYVPPDALRERLDSLTRVVAAK